MGRLKEGEQSPSFLCIFITYKLDVAQFMEKVRRKTSNSDHLTKFPESGIMDLSSEDRRRNKK